MSSLRFLAPTLLALAFGAAPAASAQSFSDSQRGEIEQIVKRYLLAHPEVLEEVSTELGKRQAATEALKHESAVTENADAIFNSQRGVTLGNKNGDVTFVEFFDYNCGYCKRAMIDMLELLKSDQKLKVVLKEFPVLGQSSVEAAQVAVAARMQDPTGKKYLDFHQKLLGSRGQADKSRALAAAKAPHARPAPVGRPERVEHEALATVMAARAGVRVPEVVIAALGAHGDAIIATRRPDVAPLEDSAPDEVSNDRLRELWGQVSLLHAAGISHGRLNTRNVLMLDEGSMLIDFSAATLGAPQSALDMDVAELLVACVILVGQERALDEALAAGWENAIGRVIPYLQPAALTPHLRDRARAHDVGVKQLRQAAAAATGEDVPEPAPLLRVRLKDLLLSASLVFAAYLLISQLADIGFRTIADELRDANAAWVVVALILAQSAFIGNGVSVRGAVAEPLPLLPCIVLQSAMKFINLTVPSSAGRIGLNLRFLQRLGVPLPQAVAAGAVDDASNTIVQFALFLIAIPFVHAQVDASQFRGAAPDTRLVLAIGLALALSIAAIFLLPKVRARVLPPIRSALAGLWAVTRDRRKRFELYAGSAAAELLYALSLGATCLAFGVHLNMAQLVFVNTAASVLSGLVPVPGGIGAAEASIAAGLIAMGVDESTAFAVAVTQRLSTFYLPPIWGYVSLQWLSRRGYL